jgi:hypothetical protein
MTRVIHYICNIKIKDFSLCQCRKRGSIIYYEHILHVFYYHSKQSNYLEINNGYNSLLAGVRAVKSLVFCVVICRSLFIILSVFFYSLYIKHEIVLNNNQRDFLSLVIKTPQTYHFLYLIFHCLFVHNS